MAEIVVVVPTVAAQQQIAASYAPRGRQPDRPRLVLVSNGKPKAIELLTAVGERLVDLGHVGEFEIAKKAVASKPMEDGEATYYAARSHLIVTGLGS